MEDTRRTRQSNPPLHRDLAQHQETPQRPEHAHTKRIPEPSPPTRDRHLIPDPRPRESRVRSPSPPNPGRLKVPSSFSSATTSNLTCGTSKAARPPRGSRAPLSMDFDWSAHTSSARLEPLTRCKFAQDDSVVVDESVDAHPLGV